MVNNSSIDWLFPWPNEALLAVATELIMPDNPLIPAQYRKQIIEHHVDVHKSVIDVSWDFVTTLRRQNYVTPKNFLDFINTYQVHTPPLLTAVTAANKQATFTYLVLYFQFERTNGVLYTT